jgi:hypothetical protein
VKEKIRKGKKRIMVCERGCCVENQSTMERDRAGGQGAGEDEELESSDTPRSEQEML